MKLLKRTVALMLTLCLMLPVLAFGENIVVPGTAAYQYSLNFHLDPDAFPAQDEPETLQGIADLVNILSVTGETTTFGISFDTRAEIMLNNAPETKTSLRVLGPHSHWMVGSSLLGEERVYFNMLALLEFAMKGYFHLGLPLQLPALLASPYVHITAPIATWDVIQKALGDGAEVTLTKEQLKTIATTIADNYVNDRALSYWFKAMLLDAGYDETAEGWIRTLPEWVDAWADAGLTVTRTEAQETWVSGDLVLYDRTVTAQGTKWAIHLPALPDGNQIDLTYDQTSDGAVQQLQVNLTIGSEDAQLLSAALQGENLPLSMVIPQDGKLDVQLEGPMAGKWAGHHQVLLQGDGQNASIQWMNTEKQMPMVTVSGTIASVQPAFTPYYPPEEVTGVNLLSVNDESLKEFVAAVTGPVTKGMIPLLIEVPASSYQAVYKLLEDYGILTLLTADLEDDS